MSTIQIRIRLEVKRFLDELKRYDRETYDDVITRLIENYQKEE